MDAIIERPIGKLAGVRHSKALWFQDDAQRLCAVVGILDFSAGGLSGAFHDVFVNQRLDRLCENRCGREQKRRPTARKALLPGRCPNVKEKLALASIQVTVWLAPGC